MSDRLNKYTVFLKLTVWGESPEDALDYANSAIDTSDMLSQDGIVGIELIDDIDSIELVDEDENDDDDGENEEDY
jgi:hypothetical protein